MNIGAMVVVATALLVPLAGCLAGEADSKDATNEAATNGATAAFHPATWTWQGEFLAGGVDGAHEYAFDVPNGTTEVAGLLTWSIPGAVLDFYFLDPTGAENGNGWGESDNHRFVTNTYPVNEGTWIAVVVIDQGVDAHYDFTAHAGEAMAYGPIDFTYEVPAGDFAEINFNMAPGDHFDFMWESAGEVYFNVHYHADGTTERPFEYTGTELASNFTAPDTEVYSMLWRNNGVLPVTVTGTVDGQYRIHSMTRDAADVQ